MRDGTSCAILWDIYIYSSDNLTHWFPKSIGCRVTVKFAVFQGFILSFSLHVSVVYSFESKLLD